MWEVVVLGTFQHQIKSLGGSQKITFCSLEHYFLDNPWRGVKTLYFPRGKEKWLGRNNAEREGETEAEKTMDYVPRLLPRWCFRV